MRGQHQPVASDRPTDAQADRPGRAGASGILTATAHGVVDRSRRLVERVAHEVRPAASGLDALPASGIILAAHHGRASDFRRISAVLPSRPWLVAADAAFRHPGEADIRRYAAVHRSRLVPLTDQDRPSRVGATSLLAAGRVVVIFPEGDPSPASVVCKGHPEVAWLALTSRVPVVPVTIRNAVERSGQDAPGPQVLFGEPLDLSRFWSTPPLSDVLDGAVLRGVTDLIMAAIAELSGLAYVDDYVPAVSARLAEHRAVERAHRRRRRIEVTEEEKRRLVAQARAERDYRESVELAEAQTTLRAWITRVSGNDVPTPADPDSTR